jgi:hypothetical protein
MRDLDVLDVGTIVATVAVASLVRARVDRLPVLARQAAVAGLARLVGHDALLTAVLGIAIAVLGLEPSRRLTAGRWIARSWLTRSARIVSAVSRAWLRRLAAALRVGDAGLGSAAAAAASGTAAAVAGAGLGILGGCVRHRLPR